MDMVVAFQLSESVMDMLGKVGRETSAEVIGTATGTTLVGTGAMILRHFRRNYIKPARKIFEQALDELDHYTQKLKGPYRAEAEKMRRSRLKQLRFVAFNEGMTMQQAGYLAEIIDGHNKHRQKERMVKKDFRAIQFAWKAFEGLRKDKRPFSWKIK